MLNFPGTSLRPLQTGALSLFLTVLLVPLAAHAQEIQIFVNGPWSYAPTTDAHGNPQIALIAPVSTNHYHTIHVSPGPDATTTPGSASDPGPGKYDLSLVLARCKRTSTTGYEAKANPFQVAVSTSAITAAIAKAASANAFAILLPPPCYASSESTSWSRMSTAASPTEDTFGAPDGYTTLMVLHYWVSSLTATVAGQNFTLIPAPGEAIPALSINLASPPLNDPQCDRHSIESVTDTASLFTTNLHGWFPSLHGSAQSATYDLPCLQYTYLTKVSQRLDKAKRVLKDIEQIRRAILKKDLDDAREPLKRLQATLDQLWPSPLPGDVKKELGDLSSLIIASNDKRRSHARPAIKASTVLKRTKDYVRRSVGSGDCHMAQLNINNALQ